MIRLDIFAEPICPWCYIAKALLDRALETRPDHPFVIEWHPFQLDPDLPREGMDLRAYLEAKFGSQAEAVAAFMQVQTAAEAAGLDIAFDRIERMPNTLDAHRLIHWAGIEGRQTPMVAALFRAYFREGLDIGDRSVLADLAAQVGMDRAAVARLLATDADRDDIAARAADARAKGVRAVPIFLVDRRHVMPGAQPVELWQQVIDEIAALSGPHP
ncbi:predicted DsbA family dithiol-disulfide isomerase [Cereibacter ovatus]|uniref:Predicted DsbA family dithiol-disulfide isomerase n=1 Tax=Cereibacter ovatus TaxID=439529 RepID=A0A285D1I8_9RHOB|nr:DsbA family oxidoreductase [Cereibacter ovatus]SNX73671.1 predicted DsbA family dithiol-disulfide isomerase [Cereibacter ovatus]